MNEGTNVFFLSHAWEKAIDTDRDQIMRLLFIRITVVGLHDSVPDHCVLLGHNTGSENIVDNHAFHSLSLRSHMCAVSKNTLDSYKAWLSGNINESSLKNNQENQLQEMSHPIKLEFFL